MYSDTMKHIILIVYILFFPECFCVLQSHTQPLKYNVSYLKVENGLCDNSINCIYKDKQGFMWIATSNGLDRYDGYEYTHYSTFAEQAARRIKNNYINCIVEDESNKLWIGTESGIMSLDLMTEKIELFDNYTLENAKILSEAVQTLFKDNKGNIWVGYNDGLALLRLDPDGNLERIQLIEEHCSVTAICQYGNNLWIGGNDIFFSIMKAGDEYKKNITEIKGKMIFHAITSFCPIGEYLWIGTDNGLYQYDILNQIIQIHTPFTNNMNNTSEHYITCIRKDKSGNMIIGTKNGLSFYQLGAEISTYKQNVTHESINSNLIKSLYVDNNDYIWVGTEVGGVNLMTRKRILFKHDLQDPGYRQNMISCVMEDAEGNILAGIEGAGLAIQRKGESSFSFFTHSRTDKTSIGSNHITKIIQDPHGDYWLALSDSGINKLKKENLHQPVFEHFTTQTHALSSNDINDIILDTIRNRLWICHKNNIDYMELEGHYFHKLHYSTDDDRTLESLNTIYLDRYSRLWIGGNGVYVIDLKIQDPITHKYICTYFEYKLDAPDTKMKEKIACINETSDSIIYLGSRGNGIYVLEEMDENEFHFHNYGVSSGLSDTMISNIVEDDNGSLWISTINGVYLFDTSIKRAFKFDTNDGLHSAYFMPRSGCKLNNGDICMGTVDGIETFNPIVKVPRIRDRKVIFTHLWAGNTELIPYLYPKNIASSIAIAQECHIYPPESSFEVSYASMDFIEQNKIFYKYKLEGYDKKYTIRLGERRIRYGNLPPGKYIFKVKCTNFDNTWPEEYTRLNVIIHPAFYQTIWFRLILALLIICFVFFLVYRYGKEQKNKQNLLKKRVNERTSELQKTMEELVKSKNEIDLQNEKLRLQNKEIREQKDHIQAFSHKMESINKEKIEFFTNITHEFKTPLTLILGSVNNLLKVIAQTSEKEHLSVIQRNAHHLLALINQLMDLRKIDTNNLSLSFSTFDLMAFLQTVLKDFSSVLTERGITLQTCIHMSHNIIESDQKNLRKVLYNLLSNAVKFTPNGGCITIHAAQIHHTETRELLQYLSVTNTGSHIPETEITAIFDKFYQVNKQASYTSYGQSSTGIGLYLVKQIITLLKGKIQVKNLPHHGGVAFRLFFPVQLAKDVITAKVQLDYQEFVPTESDDLPFIIQDKEKPILLLVEDNKDMRQYIKNMLLGEYNIAEAINGNKGLEMAQQILPDFIISDLMMPVCDGFEFFHKIKEDKNLCHIPFLLLTAQSSEEAKVKGYNLGIDDYLTKPFEEDVLKARIHGILKNRRKSQQQLLNDLSVLSKPISASYDHLFIEKLLSVMAEQYNNPEFNVSELQQEMGMSNTLLYKKITSLTGLSASRFILLYRLQIAKKLIENTNSNLSISDIAYKVGFNDPKYFTRCFTKHYNISPSKSREIE